MTQALTEYDPAPVVQVDHARHVVTVTLNRPDRMNAMTPDMDRQLRTAVVSAGQDPQCRVIVIRGSGKGFCSGADRSPATTPSTVPAWQPFPSDLAAFRFGYLLESPKPVVAAINGAAIGVGLVLACYCDIRLAMDTAKLGFPYSRLGLIAEYGIAHLLPGLIGAGRARELLLSGRLFDGIQAERMGLVNHVSDSAAFDSELRDYVDDLAAQCSPRSIRAIKKQLSLAAGQDLLDAVHTASAELQAARESADYTEAISARRDRRPPQFKELDS